MAFTDAPPKDTFDKRDTEELQNWVSRGAEAAAGQRESSFFIT